MSDIQEQKKRRVRFSVIDFVIILLILACGTGIVMRYDLVGRLFSNSAQKEARIAFVAEAISQEEAEVFRNDTKVYVGDSLFGTVSSVETTPAIIYRENANGVLISYEDESLADVHGTVTAEAVFSENGCLLNGNTFLAPGSVFTIQAHGISVTITILSVENAAS